MTGLEIKIQQLQECISKSAEMSGRNSHEIRLVIVSKGKPLEDIQKAYDLGFRDFGESRVQEALPKIEKGPKDIRWHYIGKLQMNKVGKVVGKFALIHSVDTPELAKKIAEKSLQMGISTSILLQSNTSKELSKGGLSPKEWEEQFCFVYGLGGIRIEGLMTLAPLTENETVIRHCFAELKNLQTRLRSICKDSLCLPILSMGMTHDFTFAIEEGATLVRIGRGVWG